MTESATYQWPALLESYFGLQLSLDEAKLWQRELQRNIWHLTDKDVCEAIRSRAHDKQERRFRPTLQGLTIWIKQWRRAERDWTRNESNAQSQKKREHHIAAWKKRLDFAQTNEERWIIICEPTNADECVALESYVRQIHPTFRRPRLANIDSITKGIAKEQGEE